MKKKRWNSCNHKTDVSIEEEFVNAIKTIIDSDGELSYLVNNAGITKDKLALRMSIEDFTSVLDANLTSAFIGCREALKVLGKKFGSIVKYIFNSWRNGNQAGKLFGFKRWTKCYTKSFAKEAANRNIRYNAVTPGFIQTDMTNLLKMK